MKTTIIATGDSFITKPLCDYDGFDEITDVIITHAHHDHIEAVKHFEKAILHISSEELEAARKYIPKNMNLCVFVRKPSSEEMVPLPQVKKR